MENTDALNGKNWMKIQQYFDVFCITLIYKSYYVSSVFLLKIPIRDNIHFPKFGMLHSKSSIQYVQRHQ